MPATKTKALIKPSATDKFVVDDVDLPEMGPHRVKVKTEFAGVCHSDLAMATNGWGITQYPFVGGHEIIGTVAEVGDSVSGVKVGDLVGVGWFAGSCGQCVHCLGGHDNLCQTSEKTILGRHGGFANHVIVDDRFAFKLPDGLDKSTAGPLLCAGITVFEPLFSAGVSPTAKVGVVGMGGLGHLAVQIANKWGCHVTAFTSTPDKSDLATKLGAHRVLPSKDAEELAKHKGELDLIIVTVAADLDWNLWVSLLAPSGKLHFSGVPPSPVPLAIMPMVFSGQSVGALPSGPPISTIKMLEFCARHKIEPMVDAFKFSDINNAMAHLEAGKARFRVVLENDLPQDS